MNKKTHIKILEHPDRDEILSKIIIGLAPKDIYEWLKSKYINPNENKFVISEKALKDFKSNYLDIYNFVQQDISKTKIALVNGSEDQLELAINDLPAYRDLILKSANEEFDVRKMIKNLCIAIEHRVCAVFDDIRNDPNNINTKIERLLIDYAEILGTLLEKFYKFTEEPANNVIQHNVTLQVVDQHISVFHDVIKNVLSQMDLETSLYFMEVFHEEMSKLKPFDKEAAPSSEMKLAEAKLLNETIKQKINV